MSLKLPGLNCGSCGYRTCDEFADVLRDKPELIKRCLPMSTCSIDSKEAIGCGSACGESCGGTPVPKTDWKDSLGREIDFYLEHFPEDPGPKEIIIPHNPMLTRELEIEVGDILVGRPLGMSCGCPITHCGKVMEVDRKTGVMSWCVTGPLDPREKGFKDLGYYIAEGYEGLVVDTRKELRIGERYFFQPRMCMLQWRHSGLINYLNHSDGTWQVRLEGLWIG